MHSQMESEAALNCIQERVKIQIFQHISKESEVLMTRHLQLQAKLNASWPLAGSGAHVWRRKEALSLNFES